MAGEESSEKGNKMKELAEAYGYEGKDPEVVHVLPPPGGVAMFDVQVLLEKTWEGVNSLGTKSRAESGTCELEEEIRLEKDAAVQGKGGLVLKEKLEDYSPLGRDGLRDQRLAVADARQLLRESAPCCGGRRQECQNV